MKRISAAAALVPLVLLAGCGGTGTPPGTAATTTTEPSAVPSAGASAEPSGPSAEPASPSAVPPATPPTAPPVRVPSPSVPASGPPTAAAGVQDLPPPTGTDPVRVRRSPAEPPLVLGVRFAAHQRYDRVVIDLRGTRTGYTVDRVARLVEDGSGDPVDLPGEAFLRVRISPAAAHTDDGRPTWKRRPVLRADLPNLRGVVRAGDFEGVVTVGLGLRHPAAFRVFEQPSPPRLIIDIAH
ncbi:hypothetical protein Sru01_05290 [Sphaerisporangium rufum]|uniref:AMIN-like domain-containing protein n=1 Tax=Sphaerisporangium rufum TaxID=1381558 RepID=A0A919R229_9ACTN|nr:hypothetical protein [Sphaerisporangium rufum]GII75547.1 hypothetical protein Sru01_05290 [Sphaerisporangium rufum]